MAKKWLVKGTITILANTKQAAKEKAERILDICVDDVFAAPRQPIWWEVKERKYSKSCIERVCEMCDKPIAKGQLYRMIRHYGRWAGDDWPICKECDS